MASDSSTSRDATASTPRRIYFATTSSVKLNQYRAVFADLGVQIVKGATIESVLVEPQHEGSEQSNDVRLVGHPLRLAARFVARMGQIPYMIEDTMLFVRSLSSQYDQGGGLPGADTKNWWLNLQDVGLLGLLGAGGDRRARFVCQIGVYLGGSKYCFAKAEIEGVLADAPRVSEKAKADVPTSNPFYFHSIFVPDNATETLGEMDGRTFVQHDYRRRCAISLMDEIARQSIKWSQTTQLSFFD